jgi:hypothetical protein
MLEMLEEIMVAIAPNIFEIVLAIISLVVANYAIPYIKNDFMPWFKEKRIYGTVKKFVQAVEKMAEANIINKTDKKAKVIELLKSKGIEVNDVIDAFIESCVKELDMITSVVYEEIIEEEEN